MFSTTLSQEEKSAIDPSPFLPLYTASTITLLLKTYGINSESTSQPSKDTTGQFDIYTHASPYLTSQLLLKDNIDYFLAHGLASSDRRVAFLISSTKTCIALIVQLQNFDKNKAQALLTLLKQQGLDSCDKILASPEIATYFKPLYDDVNCLVIGAEESPDLIIQLQALLELAYANRKHLVFIPLDVHNPSIVLLEYVLSMLTQNRIEEEPVNTLEAFYSHRRQAITSFINMLEIQQPELHLLVKKNFIILFKQLALAHERNKRHGIVGDDLEALDLILTRDLQVKAAIFQSAVNIEAGLQSLDFEPLMQILKHANKLETLLTLIKNTCQERIEISKAWTADLKARHAKLNKQWLPYLFYQSKKAAKFLYHFSLAGLAGELLPWITKPAVKSLTLSPWTKQAKILLQSGTKITLLCATLSPTLAKRGYEATGQWLTEANSLFLLKITGASAGLAYMCATMNPYTFVCQIGVGSVALKLGGYLTKPILDDENAQALPQGRLSRWGSPNNVMRTASLSLALFETAYWQDYQSLLETTVGMSSSMGMTTLVLRLFPALSPIPGNANEEDKVFALFLLSFMGYNLGQGLSNVWFKEAARAQMLLLLKSPKAQTSFPEGRVIELPALTGNPLRWFNTDNPIKLEWRNPRQNFFSQTECQIRGRLQRGLMLSCDSPVTQSLPVLQS